MPLDKYEVFVQVAESCNITRAAAELNYTHSAISHIIRNLEEEVGLPLFHRSKNGLRLTSQGESLLPYARQVVHHQNCFEQHAAAIKGLNVGSIRVGAFSSVSMQWMPDILVKLHEAYPGITVTQSHGNYPDIERELQDGQVDCGFLSTNHSGHYHFIPLVYDEYLLLLPPGHPLEKYERVPVEALNGESFVLMDDGGEPYDTAQILRSFDHRVTHWVNEDYLAIPLVERGLGLSILPRLILDGVRTNVTTKRFAVPRYRQIGIAVKSLDDTTPLTRVFIDLVQEYIQHKYLD